MTLLEIAVDNFNELFRRADTTFLTVFRVDKVVPDVVFQHDRKQTVHRSATTRDPLQHVRTAVLFLERPFDGFDLPLDAADPVEEPLFFMDCVTHCATSK
ncbi:hypothetical protein BCY88_29550 [Paraburkholderia fungorum]|uniref:Uncharacterized protein n=1 Tax=Paraburkholderia fungorum TaxID=134537 RepID=A0A420GGC9_9BURK|nr:hypothetical protein BCY88_29550 [Paraburkholderia fungorum]